MTEQARNAADGKARRRPTTLIRLAGVALVLAASTAGADRMCLRHSSDDQPIYSAMEELGPDFQGPARTLLSDYMAASLAEDADKVLSFYQGDDRALVQGLLETSPSQVLPGTLGVTTIDVRGAWAWGDWTVFSVGYDWDDIPVLTTQVVECDTQCSVVFPAGPQSERYELARSFAASATQSGTVPCPDQSYISIELMPPESPDHILLLPEGFFDIETLRQALSSEQPGEAAAADPALPAEMVACLDQLRAIDAGDTFELMEPESWAAFEALLAQCTEDIRPGMAIPFQSLTRTAAEPGRNRVNLVETIAMDIRNARALVPMARFAFGDTEIVMLLVLGHKAGADESYWYYLIPFREIDGKVRIDGQFPGWGQDYADLLLGPEVSAYLRAR